MVMDSIFEGLLLPPLKSMSNSSGVCWRLSSANQRFLVVFNRLIFTKISNLSGDCSWGAYANRRFLVLLNRLIFRKISNSSGDCPRGAYANLRFLVLIPDDSVRVCGCVGEISNSSGDGQYC